MNVNQYGQSDPRVLANLLAQHQGAPMRSPLEAGLRALAVGMQANNAREYEAQRKDEKVNALANAMMGLNRQGLTSEGPTDGAGRIADPMALARILANPETAPVGAVMLQDAMRQDKPEAFTLGPGQVRYQGGQMVARGPEAAPKVPAGVQEYEYARQQGYPGTFADWQQSKSMSPRDRVFSGLSPEEQKQVLLKPGVQFTQSGELEEQKAYGKQLVETYGGIQDAAGSARQQIAALQQAREINRSGAEVPSKLRFMAGNAITAMGFDPKSFGLENISNGQQFNALMQNLVLSKMQEQKGPQTERDAQRIESTVAGLGNTPEARDFLLRSALASNQMSVLREVHWQNWRRQHGTFDGAAEAWSAGLGKERFVAKNPISGVTIFLPDFVQAMRQEHPDAPMEDILDVWRAYE